jgi:hypothetical protein
MNPDFASGTAAWLTIAGATLLGGCGDENSPPQAPTAGTEKTGKTAVLETGAAALQGKSPLSKLNVYLDGFHFASGDLRGQMEAHHYCALLNEDVIQCALYDGNGEDAHLIGIEYVVSAKVFRSLPEDERALWHSHAFEVSSGQLIAPGIPQPAEHELMEKLVSTYGKTWHTWHTHHGDAVPLGIPHLMMGFTGDGQVREALVAQRDQRFGIDSRDKKKQRADIIPGPVEPGADAWQQDEAVQLDLRRAAD